MGGLVPRAREKGLSGGWADPLGLGEGLGSYLNLSPGNLGAGGATNPGLGVGSGGHACAVGVK